MIMVGVIYGSVTGNIKEVSNAALEILVEIYSLAACPFGIPGNIKETNGCIPFVSLPISPEVWAISINPTHNRLGMRGARNLA